MSVSQLARPGFLSRPVAFVGHRAAQGFASDARMREPPPVSDARRGLPKSVAAFMGCYWAQLRLQRAHEELGLIGDRSLPVLTHVDVEVADRVALDLVSRPARGQLGRVLCGRERV